MAKKYRLTNLTVDDVSSVDKGAGEGVRVVLAKRADPVPVFKSFDEAIAKVMDFDDAKNKSAIDQAVWSLQSVISAILCDDDTADKGAAIAASISQFKDYVAGLAPVSKSTTENDPMPMTAAETAALEKQIADSVTKAVTAVTTKFEGEIARRDEEIAILKLSPELQEFRKAMTPEEKKKFDAMTAEEKDEAAKETKKRAVDKLDPEIKKRLDQADQNEKVLKALVEKDEIATFAKRATGLGLPETAGETIRKAYGGDAAAQTELDKLLKGLTEQVKVGKVFDEFGNGGPGKGDKSAYEEIVEKAVELRKTADGSKLTEAQARVKVMEDPANAELMKRHRGEEVRKRAA